MNIRMQICPNCFFAPYDSGRCPSCGYTATESDGSIIALPPGTVLNERYLLGRLLGLGGFGVTYLALDTTTQTMIAIKEYFPSSLAVREEGGTMKFNGKGDSRVFDHGMRAFIREAKSLHKFVGEKNIVQVSHSFYENGTAYFVMEYLNGINLKVLRNGMGGKIPFPFAFDVLLTLASTLGKVHKAGLLHRDVSPENIFVTKSGDVKLLDFGATRYYIGDESRSLAIVLKPGFAPPEQYTSKGEQGPWTDVYALAATFYQSISGQRVPDAPDRLAGTPIANLNEFIPEPDRRISAVIEKALALNHRKRYQNMDEFEKALRKYGPAETGDQFMIPSPASEKRFPEPANRVPAPTPEKRLPEPANRPPAPSPEKRLPEPANRAPAPVRSVDAGTNDSAIVRLAKRAVRGFRTAGTPYISVASGSLMGEKWAIPYNVDIRIGRQSGANHIVISDGKISREHCVVRYDQKNGVFFLRDVSTNGTFSEAGRRYEKGRDVTLAPGSGFFLIMDRLLVRVGLE